MQTPQELQGIAKKISKMTGRTGTGTMVVALRESLGFEGYKTALDKRWISVDNASGFAHVTHDKTKLAEIRQLAEAKIEESAPANARQTMPCREFSLPPSYSSRIDDIRARQAALVEDQPIKPQVGQQVMIGEDGREYMASIKEVKQNGRVVLSFGTEKPRQIQPEYDGTQIRPIVAKPGTTAPAPAPVTQ